MCSREGLQDPMRQAGPARVLTIKLARSPAERSSRALMLFMMRASSEGRLAVSAHTESLGQVLQQANNLSLDCHELIHTAF